MGRIQLRPHPHQQRRIDRFAFHLKRHPQRRAHLFAFDELLQRGNVLLNNRRWIIRVLEFVFNQLQKFLERLSVSFLQHILFGQTQHTFQAILKKVLNIILCRILSQILQNRINDRSRCLCYTPNYQPIDHR